MSPAPGTRPGTRPAQWQSGGESHASGRRHLRHGHLFIPQTFSKCLWGQSSFQVSGETSSETTDICGSPSPRAVDSGGLASTGSCHKAQVSKRL